MSTATLTPAERRAVAVAGDTHPSTVDRYLAGDRVRPISASRIERGLRATGHQDLVREPVNGGHAT